MTPPGHPYLRLRAPVVVGILLLAGGIAIVAGSRHLLATAENRAHSAAQTLADVERRLANAEHVALLSREALAHHAQMQAAGFDRPTDRVRWVEQMEALRKAMPVVQLDYEIGPEHPMQGDRSEGPPTLFASTLHVQARVAHEDAFLTLIRQLREASPALRPTRCQLSRQTDDSGQESLSVRCDVDWIRARLSPSETASPSSAGRAVGGG